MLQQENVGKERSKPKKMSMLTSGVTKVDLGFKESSSLSLMAVLKNRKRMLFFLIDSIVDGNSPVTEIVS